MDALRVLLAKAISMIDDGKCPTLSQEELETISNILNPPVAMGRETAAKFLGVSLNEFHKLIHEGIISPPRKVAEFKELHYYASDLKKSLEKLKNK